MGWRVGGAFPDLPKLVLIVAPHTSNRDFFVGLAAKFALGLDAVWIGKHSIFRWPVAGLLRRWGGIPVVRHEKHDVVQRIAAEFAARERMVFALSPEGTRRRITPWRTGFYHVARAAGVPILPVALDYATRTIHIGTPLTATGDYDADMAAPRALFAAATPRHPDAFAL
jgi:1-acyl-sn-glycerol-3-phosphate acyltransferase